MLAEDDLEVGMTWDVLIQRVTRGETTVEDALLIARVRDVLVEIAAVYPGSGYFAALARLLRLNSQLTGDADDDHR